MTKTQRPKGSKKRKGGRQPVAFVVHPDTGLPIKDLRIHKSSASYYRIADDKISRHRYHKNGRVGLAYLRRAIHEHECWRSGREPTDSVQVRVTESAHDDFGSELPVVATFDDDGRAVNVTYLGRADMAAYFREQLSNPLTRKEFADDVGYPELINLGALEAPPKPLTLQEMIDRYAKDKTFARKSQTKDAQTIWAFFTANVAVDLLEDVVPDNLQRYKRAIETNYPNLRTQKNHYLIVQGILNHARKIFEEHERLISKVKQRIRDNCQDWSQDKKRKANRKNAKPMNPATFRKMLAQAKKRSKMAHAFFLSAANFAMHGKEAAEMRHDDLDFDLMRLSSYREKDSVQRVAWIWNETKAAIKTYLESDENHHHHEFLLTDENGKPMNIGKVVRLNRKLREDAALPFSVKFDGIRSLTSTAMGAENLIAQKWVMGHVTGELDTYTVRDAKETKRALTKARKTILGK